MSQRLSKSKSRRVSEGFRAIRVTNDAVISITVFAGLWLILLIGMLTTGGWGISTHVGISFSSDARAAREAFGGTDAGSYLQAALGLWDLGPRGIDGNQWVYNLWPPGMVALNLLAVTVESTLSIPYLLALVLLMAAIWAAVLTRLCKILGEVAPYFGFVFLLVFLLTSSANPMITVYFAYGDGIAAGLVGLAIAELWIVRGRSVRDNLKRLIYVGLLLSGAMHLRTTFETLSWFLLIVPLVAYVVWVALSHARRNIDNVASRGALAQVSFVAFVAQTLSIPWRAFAGVFIRPGDYRWSTVLDGVWSGRWRPTELYSPEAGFLRAGHANFACLNDPERCQEIALFEQGSLSPYTGNGFFTQEEFREMLLASFLETPLQYAQERLGMFFLGFFSKTGGGIGQFDVLEGLLLLVGVVIGITTLILTRQFNRAGVWISFLTAAGLSGILLFFHMETRYLLPIKLTMLVFIFLVLAEFLAGKFSRKQEPDVLQAH